MNEAGGSPEAVCALENNCPISDSIAQLAVKATEIQDSADRLVAFKKLGEAARAAEKICRTCRLIQDMRGSIVLTAEISEARTADVPTITEEVASEPALLIETLAEPAITHEDELPITDDMRVQEALPDAQTKREQVELSYENFSSREDVALAIAYFKTHAGEPIRPKEIKEFLSMKLEISEANAQQRWNTHIIPALENAGLLDVTGRARARRYSLRTDALPVASEQTLQDDTPILNILEDAGLKPEYAEETDGTNQDELELETILPDLTMVTDWGLAVSALPETQDELRHWLPEFYVNDKRLSLEWNAAYTLFGLVYQPDGLDGIDPEHLYRILQNVDHRMSLKKVRHGIQRCVAFFGLRGLSKAIIIKSDPIMNVNKYAVSGLLETTEEERNKVLDFLAQKRSTK